MREIDACVSGFGYQRAPARERAQAQIGNVAEMARALFIRQCQCERAKGYADACVNTCILSPRNATSLRTPLGIFAFDTNVIFGDTPEPDFER